MCGIFGFVAKDNGELNMGILERVARVTQTRGPHSWGLAWVDSQDRLRMYKQTGKISDSLGLLAMARDAKMLIGHCRYATHGNPNNNLNNHPHPSDGGWIVHNGVIGHYRHLIDQHSLHPVTDCDSEVVGLLIESLPGNRFERCAKAATLAKGRSPFAMMGLWSDRLILARANGQPLHCGETRRGFYFASLAKGLPGEVAEFYENQVYEYGEESNV